jgi:hypothetical protein
MTIEKRFKLKIVRVDGHTYIWSGKDGGYSSPNKCLAAYKNSVATMYRTMEEEKELGTKFILVEETHTIETQDLFTEI